MNILHRPPLSNLHLTFISVSPLLSYSSISSGFPLRSLSLQPTIHPAILRSFSCSPLFSFSLVSLQCNQLSLLFLAKSGFFSYNHNFLLCSTYFLLFLFFSTHLSVYMSALAPFCQLIPVIYTIKCFCIPWVAGFLFYSPMSPCSSCLHSLFRPSILSHTSDKARE